MKCLETAIDVGYRHFDTATNYKTEAILGEAIRNKIADGTVKREDIFITSKVSLIPFFVYIKLENIYMHGDI